MGVVGNYVDDNSNAENKKFQDLTELALTAFKSKPRVSDNFLFFGTYIVTKSPGTFQLKHKRYVHTLLCLLLECDIAAFRRARSLLARTQYCGPEFACLEIKALQFTKETLCKSATIDLKKDICEANSSLNRGLAFASLDLSTLRFCVYVDVSFVTSCNLPLQLGYVILLGDVINLFHILDYCSRKF